MEDAASKRKGLVNHNFVQKIKNTNRKIDSTGIAASDSCFVKK